ncbi:MAG: NfeD family protein [Geminicoccaceae bacterium]
MTGWGWLTVGGLLLLLELLTPGVASFWLGLSALATGLVVWLRPGLSWQVQALLFALGAFVAVAAWLRLRRRHPPQDAAPGLNQRGLSLVGREAELATATELGRGRVKVGDGTWPAEGPSLPAGTPVRIVGARGTLLLIEPLAAPTAAPARQEGSPSEPGSSI